MNSFPTQPLKTCPPPLREFFYMQEAMARCPPDRHGLDRTFFPMAATRNDQISSLASSWPLDPWSCGCVTPALPAPYWLRVMNGAKSPPRRPERFMYIHTCRTPGSSHGRGVQDSTSGIREIGGVFAEGARTGRTPMCLASLLLTHRGGGLSVAKEAFDRLGSVQIFGADRGA